jgi:predicted neuraminidase
MRSIILFLLSGILIYPTWAGPNNDAIIKNEFIFNLQANHVHSSSLVELPNGDILTVWFQIMDKGRERTSENVRLMGARLKAGQESWSMPFLMAETPFLPDGNPVLFLNNQKKLFLIWHVLQAEVWHAAILKVRTSTDYLGDGAPNWDWQDNITLKITDDFAKEVKTKLKATTTPELTEIDTQLLAISQNAVLRNIGWMSRLQPIILQHGSNKGRILLPLYNESQRLSLCAISDDDGTTWTPGLPIVGRDAIQPVILEKDNGDIVSYMRDASNRDYRVQTSTSTDAGYSWTPVIPTTIKNPGSSLDAKVLKDGRWAMICNDLENLKRLGIGCCDGRQTLSVYLSNDEGLNWTPTLKLVSDTNKPNKLEMRGRFHYPSLIQTCDGMLHITYTYNIRETPYADGIDNAIKHVIIDPHKIP